MYGKCISSNGLFVYIIFILITRKLPTYINVQAHLTTCLLNIAKKEVVLDLYLYMYTVRRFCAFYI